MTVEGLIALFGALTAVLTAVTALLVQVRRLRMAVNGVMHELVDARAAAAEKEGELRGRDFVTSQSPVAPPAEIREHI